MFDKIDRYTRDQSQDEVRTLNQLVKQGRIELHFPSDNLFINKNSPAAYAANLNKAKDKVSAEKVA